MRESEYLIRRLLPFLRLQPVLRLSARCPKVSAACESHRANESEVDAVIVGVRAGSAPDEGLRFSNARVVTTNGRKKERRSQRDVFGSEIAFALGMDEHVRVELRGALPIAVVDRNDTQDVTTSGDDVTVFGEVGDPECFGAAHARLRDAIRKM